MTDNQSDGQTKEELYEQAQELDIEGRSSMDKDELAAAVAAAESDESDDGQGETATVSADQSQPSQAGGFQPVENNADTYDSSGGEFLPVPGPEAHNQSQIKSRAEEEADQHARREAGDAAVEAKVAAAKQTPF